jgi:DNA invertase Pin-like site-specific DNA recombinase
MMVKTTPRAAVYGRESKGKTKSVADQVRIGETAVAEQGWMLAGTWKDRTSASRFATKDRDDWDALRTELDAGAIDVIVLWETSRGSRTLTAWSQLLDACREHRVKIHIVNHDRTYDPRRSSDWKNLADDGVDAAHASDVASEAILRGVAGSALDGKPHGRIPFGYERRVWFEGSPKVKMIEQSLHPVHSILVRKIIERVASREPLVKIVRDLNGRGIPSPRESRWSSDTVRHLVRNPAYIGQRSHNGELTAATWPGIVPEPMWRAANDLLDEPGRKTSQPGGLRHLLAYIGTCPCGVGRWSAYRASRINRAYRCREDGCVSILSAPADEYVTMVVIRRLCRPDARDLFAPDNTASAAAKKRLVALTAELNAARASFAAPGGISAEALALKEQAMASPIADAQRQSRPAGAPLALLELMDAAEFGEAHVRPVWDRLSLPAKRNVITTLCESIVLGPRTGAPTRWSTEDERLTDAAARIQIVWRSE